MPTRSPKAAPTPAPAPIPPARLLTRNDLADLLRLSHDSINRLIEAGMPCLDVTGIRRAGRREYRSRRFDVAAVLRWLESRSA